MAFSRDWDPRLSLIRTPGVENLWRTFFGYAPPASRDEIKALAPYPRAIEIERGGQWADVYVNPTAVFSNRTRLAKR